MYNSLSSFGMKALKTVSLKKIMTIRLITHIKEITRYNSTKYFRFSVGRPFGLPVWSLLLYVKKRLPLKSLRVMRCVPMIRFVETRGT